jgi:hypothetical protein
MVVPCPYPFYIYRCVNDTVQSTELYIEFLSESNLIPENSNPKSEAIAYAEMVKNIGYVPNYVRTVACGMHEN